MSNFPLPPVNAFTHGYGHEPHGFTPGAQKAAPPKPTVHKVRAGKLQPVTHTKYNRPQPRK